MQLSVVICTHQPKTNILARTLSSLKAQSLSSGKWETLLIDNASQPAIGAPSLVPFSPDNLRIIIEPQLGLTHARKAGLRDAFGEIVVFVDDDNVLAHDYLEQVLAAFTRLPRVGAIGGKSLGEFEIPPSPAFDEFHPLLAIRNLGDSELISNGLRQPGSEINSYPLFAPIGAGMAVRREAIQPWLKCESSLSDRRGKELSSSGDNDIVLTIMEAGWEVAYIPQLSLTHLIPTERIEPNYLASLNHGIQRSWTQVLLAHHACPWPRISRWSVPFRKIKSWLAHRAWSSPASFIRWQGACGHFEGRALTRPTH